MLEIRVDKLAKLNR